MDIIDKDSTLSIHVDFARKIPVTVTLTGITPFDFTVKRILLLSYTEQ